jgi:hypothetical protein
MILKKPTIAIFLFFLALNHGIVPSCLAQPKPKEDNRIKQLENEKRKLNRTTNPANRAKSLMRIAEITLSYLNDAVQLNDASSVHAYVTQYRQAVSDARNTMMMSDHDPYKKSGGYKAVEMALRKQIRALQDIARTLTLEERQPIDDTIQLVTKIRDEFIDAIFG